MSPIKEGCHTYLTFGRDVMPWRPYQDENYRDIVAYKIFRLELWHQNVTGTEQPYYDRLVVILVKLRDGSHKIWPSFFLDFGSG